MTKPITNPCPTCKKIIQWSQDNVHRPFCSKRCQLIDLGEWADEKNRIPVAPSAPGEYSDFSEWDLDEQLLDSKFSLDD